MEWGGVGLGTMLTKSATDDRDAAITETCPHPPTHPLATSRRAHTARSPAPDHINRRAAMPFLLVSHPTGLGSEPRLNPTLSVRPHTSTPARPSLPTLICRSHVADAGALHRVRLVVVPSEHGDARREEAGRQAIMSLECVIHPGAHLRGVQRSVGSRGARWWCDGVCGFGVRVPVKVQDVQ